MEMRPRPVPLLPPPRSLLRPASPMGRDRGPRAAAPEVRLPLSRGRGMVTGPEAEGWSCGARCLLVGAGGGPVSGPLAGLRPRGSQPRQGLE